jgi:hypothetical protein
MTTNRRAYEASHLRMLELGARINSVPDRQFRLISVAFYLLFETHSAEGNVLRSISVEHLQQNSPKLKTASSVPNFTVLGQVQNRNRLDELKKRNQTFAENFSDELAKCKSLML